MEVSASSGAQWYRAEGKVVILLKATGEAPKLKQDKYKVSAADKFGKVIDFLRNQLHRESIFVYINSSFAPSPDELIADLFNLFGVNGRLVVNYAFTQAWG